MSRSDAGASVPAKVAWTGGAVLLCRDCRRSKAKTIRKVLGRALREAGVTDVRVFATSCHGVCPARGTAATLLLAQTGPAAMVLPGAASGAAQLARTVAVRRERRPE